MADIRPFPVQPFFFKRLKENILDYNAKTDDDSTVLRSYLRDSGIPPSKLARALSVTEHEALSFVLGNGRMPNANERSAMKYVISNYLTGVIKST